MHGQIPDGAIVFIDTDGAKVNIISLLPSNSSCLKNCVLGVF